MTLAALQARLERFDRERGWDRVNPAHTALHIVEELGEVMREVLRLEAYKTPDEAARERLEGEIADVLMLLMKLANQYGVNVERGVVAKLEANEARFPLAESEAAMQIYEAQQNEKQL